MADLEAKLLDCDTAGYCSSSSSDNDDDIKIDKRNNVLQRPEMGTKQIVSRNYRNTGPKGVLDDYKICKAKLEEKELKKYKQIVAQAKICTLSGELQNDNLEEIRRRRLLEMKDSLYAMRKIDELTEKEQFLCYIESNRDKWVLIHIYDDDNEACITLNKVFNTLAIRYPHLRLAKVLPLTIGMSQQFKMNALPTLQVYRNESLLGNFVRITDQLGEKFTVDQLIRFLSENEIELGISEYRISNHGDDDITGFDD
ncbi:Phosducin family protein [Brugia pahangi]